MHSAGRSRSTRWRLDCKRRKKRRQCCTYHGVSKKSLLTENDNTDGKDHDSAGSYAGPSGTASMDFQSVENVFASRFDWDGNPRESPRPCHPGATFGKWCSTVPFTTSRCNGCGRCSRGRDEVRGDSCEDEMTSRVGQENWLLPEHCSLHSCQNEQSAQMTPVKSPCRNTSEDGPVCLGELNAHPEEVGEHNANSDSSSYKADTSAGVTAVLCYDSIVGSYACSRTMMSESDEACNVDHLNGACDVDVTDSAIPAIGNEKDNDSGSEASDEICNSDRGSCRGAGGGRESDPGGYPDADREDYLQDDSSNDVDYDDLPHNDLRDPGYDPDGDPSDDPDDPDHNPDEPEDPDDNPGGDAGGEPDPDDPGDFGGVQSDSNSDSDDGSTFSFHHRSLNLVCRSRNNCTAREALALLLAVGVRDSLSYEALLHSMKAFNAIFGRNYLPTYKKQLWQWLGRNDLGIKKIAYCCFCLTGHGRLELFPNEIICACGKSLKRERVKYFIVLSIRKQLSQLLSLPTVRHSLQTYRQERQLRVPDSMEDILDGSQYKFMQLEGNILAPRNNFSYTFNLDGFRLTNSSTLEAWPIYLRLNELPWTLRNKHMLLAAVWVDLKHPNMNLLLDKFVNQANALSNEGVLWQLNEGNQVESKFVPTCCIVDAKARCAILNLNTPTGYYACPNCNHAGLHVGGCVHFPYLPPVPVPERRTDNDIKRCMLEAHNNPRPVQGFKGPSPLMNVDHLDLGKAMVTDDIHPFAGVVRDHTALFLTRTRNNIPPYYIGNDEDLRRINERLLNIRTPTHVSRKPRPLETRSKWKSSEWRNWILYYSVPCLDGILPQRYLVHLELLAQAIFLVSQDIVSAEDCNEADRLFHEYIRTYEMFFGRERMTYNVHILSHVADCVREWGPIFVQSTSIFEWWNGKLTKTVTSPKGAADQIVIRFLMHRFLDHVRENEGVSEQIEAQIDTILNGGSRENMMRVDNVLLLGKVTRRGPNEAETNLMRGAGIQCAELLVYNRAVIEGGGREFRCAAYRYGGEEGKSDNSHVLTSHDEFGQIVTIAMPNNIRRVIVFINIFNTNVQRNLYVSRVAAGENVMILASLQDIRSHAILCNTPPGPFIMPLANSSEID